jgi:hypothetical protein
MSGLKARHASRLKGLHEEPVLLLSLRYLKRFEIEVVGPVDGVENGTSGSVVRRSSPDPRPDGGCPVTSL